MLAQLKQLKSSISNQCRILEHMRNTYQGITGYDRRASEVDHHLNTLIEFSQALENYLNFQRDASIAQSEGDLLCFSKCNKASEEANALIASLRTELDSIGH